jgi:uncharacterized coiled-coil DUF342 family protein
MSVNVSEFDEAIAKLNYARIAIEENDALTARVAELERERDGLNQKVLEVESVAAHLRCQFATQNANEAGLHAAGLSRAQLQAKVRELEAENKRICCVSGTN